MWLELLSSVLECIFPRQFVASVYKLPRYNHSRHPRWPTTTESHNPVDQKAPLLPSNYASLHGPTATGSFCLVVSTRQGDRTCTERRYLAPIAEGLFFCIVIIIAIWYMPFFLGLTIFSPEFPFHLSYYPSRQTVTMTGWIRRNQTL